jgi:integral membrane protein
MKVSFMLSVAAGIMFVVAALFVWYMLDALHVFSTIKELAGTIMNSDNNAYSTLVEYLALKQTVSMAIIIGVVNVVLTTALATVTAFLYNLTATLVGGVHLTLADD